MFDRWVNREHDRARLEASSLCGKLISFATTLESEGYAPRTLRRYLFAAEAFGRWLGQRKWAIDDIDESLLMKRLDSFRRQRVTGRPRGRLPDAASGLRKFAEVLRAQGDLALFVPEAATPVEKWVAAFDRHLSQVAGLSAGTRRIYRRYAQALLADCFGEGVPKWSELDAEKVGEFVRAKASGLNSSSCRAPVTATRALVRFLVNQGLVAVGLEGAVPTVRQWKPS